MRELGGSRRSRHSGSQPIGGVTRVRFSQTLVGRYFFKKKKKTRSPPLSCFFYLVFKRSSGVSLMVSLQVDYWSCPGVCCVSVLCPLCVL